VKVLFVAPVAPWPPDTGGRIRTSKLLKYLAPHAEVHLLAVRQPDLAPEARRALERLCASVRLFDRSPVAAFERSVLARPERWFYSEGLRAGLAAELAGSRYDLVHLDEPLLVRALPERVHVPVCVHHHKLDTLLHERLPHPSALRKRFEGLKLARLEAEAARRSPHHVLASAEDAAVLRSRFSGLQTQVVPCGFDPEYFAPGDEPSVRESERILFLGTMDYGPNVDGLAWMVDAILPRLLEQRSELRLDVVGRDPVSAVRATASDSVRVQGGVRDVRPYLEHTACLVAPLRVGGGTRIKLLEALAMRCPVVATPAAAEGLDLEHRRHLLLAESAEGVAQAVLELLEDPALGRALGYAGRQRVLERYRWDALALDLLAAWRRIAADSELPSRIDTTFEPAPALPAQPVAVARQFGAADQRALRRASK
jgi:glycosyltransferase involved in cell wall biosynthesis